MKYCPRCKQELPIEKFSKNAGRKDGVQVACSECMKLYRIEHYRNNKEAHYARNKKTNDKLRAYVLDIKNSTPCADCGVIYKDEPWLTEFDHINGKSENIAYMKIAGSLTNLKQELDKCELVCLICHRRRTAKRGNWKL